MKVSSGVFETFERSGREQAKRRASDRSIKGRDPSLRWPHLYDILRAKGYSKEKAARISNSRLRYRKKGKLEGLPWKKADNKKALKALVSSSQIVFACHSKACAPPPTGTGGSTGKGGGVRDMSWSDLRDEINWLNDSPRARYQAGEAYYKELHEENSRRVKSQQLEPVSASKEFPIISKSEARGDSKPVSREEFQRLATEGQAKLDKMAERAAPIKGLDDNWDVIKDESFAEATKPWGGATIDAHTGKALPQGANKFALTVKDKGTDTVSIPEGASQAEFNAAMDQAKERFRSILEREGHHLGVFHDDDLGRIDFDPVLVVPSLSDVHTIGAATRAIGGAYHFESGNGFWPPHVED